MEKISLIIPTRIRPQMMQDVWSSALNTSYYPDNLEICFYIDNDDEISINKVKDMATDKRVKYKIGERICLSQMWNEAQKLATGTIFWHGNDDFIFRSKNWDKYVIDEFNKYDDKLIFVYGRDGIWDGKKVSINGWKTKYPLATAGFIHQRWIDFSGYFLPPYFSSDYNDTWLSEIFNRCNRIIYIKDIYIEHMHYIFGKMKKDLNSIERELRGSQDNVDKLYKKLQHERDNQVNKLLKICNKKI